MAQFASLQTEIEVDTSKASQQLQSFSRGASMAFKGAALAAAGAAVAVAGIVKAITKSVDQTKKLQRASFFGASMKDAAKFQKQMGGILTKMESLAEIQKFRKLGFTDAEISKAAELSKKISVLGGVSRVAALDIIRTGDGVDKLSSALNLDMNTALDSTVKSMTNGIPRASDKARASFRMLTKETSSLKGDFDAMTQADPFKQITVSIQDAAAATLKNMRPELEDLQKSIQSVIPIIKGFLKGSVIIFSTLIKSIAKVQDVIAQTFSGKIFSDFLNNIKQLPLVGKSIEDFFKGAVIIVSSLLKSLAKVRDAIAQAFSAKVFGKIIGFFISILDKMQKLPLVGKSIARLFDTTTLDSMRKLANYNIETQKVLKKTAKDTATSAATSATKINKSLDKLRGRNRTRNQKGRAERLQELKDFQTQARAQLRNFQQFALNNISSMGGTISGAIAAMKDTPEQLRILSSAYAREIQKTNGLSMEEILLRRQSGQLTDRQAKVGALINTIRRAGLADQQEFLRNQKTITRQLQASLTVSESQKKLAEVAAATNDLQTDVLTAQRQLRDVAITQQLTITGLLEKQTRQRGKLSLLDRLALHQARAVLKSTEENQRRYEQIAAQQRPLIALMQLRAELENLITAPLQRRLDLDKQEQTSAASLLALQQQLASLQRTRSQAQLQETNGLERIKQLTLERRELEVQLRKLEVLRVTAINKADAAAIQQRIDSTKVVLSNKRQELVVQQKINAAQKAQLTLAGVFEKNINQAIGKTIPAATKLGTTLAQSAVQFAQTIGASLERLGAGFTRFVAGVKDADLAKDLGKGFLDLLSGLAANFAATFASIGAGYIALGNVGQGVATLAASGALFALSGALGALSSIADTPGTSAGSGSGGARPATGANFQQTLGGDQQQGATAREVYVVINSSPWNKTGPQEAKEFQRWLRKNQRIVGGMA